MKELGPGQEAFRAYNKKAKKNKMKHKIIDFQAALHNFQRDIALAYGVDNGVVKIGLEPDLFTRVMLDAHKKSPYMSSFTVVGAAEPQMLGVTILPRERKKEF